MAIEDILQKQRAYFATGITRSDAFRIASLQRLRTAITTHRGHIEAALKADLNKSTYETYMTELGLAMEEITYHIRHLRNWMRTRQVPIGLGQFPARSTVMVEPYGVVLIMAPWNYPVLLSLQPLIGAISAGNCAIVKPSAYAPHASQAIADIIAEAFEPEYITVIQGGREENTTLLGQRFDYLFFTGSVAVGKVVMQAAARHLTPMTLELGGKSPVIVDQSADLDLAAKRIAFGKIVNAGQTCIAPDYVLVHESVKEELISRMGAWIATFLGQAPLDNPDYPKIITAARHQHLLGLLEGCTIRFGGHSQTPFIEPTIVECSGWEAPIMQEEIFGPILPILSYSSLPQAINQISAHDKPLALYLFTRDPAVEHLVLQNLSFGGGCINDTIMHVASLRAPFGGVGASGMGSYHGKASFDTFSHHKSILKKGRFLDLPFRYHPYHEKNLRLMRRILD